MNTYAFALMIPPGKLDALRSLTAELSGSKRNDLEHSMRRHGWTKEYAWIQQVQTGDMFVMYFQSTQDFLHANAQYAASTDPFDVWYKHKGAEILDVDFGVPLRPDLVQLVYESHDLTPTGREKPMAVATMVLPGKTDAVKRMAAEISAPKKPDVQDFHRRYGVATENWYLQNTPRGDIWIYYVEAEDPDRLFREWPHSEHPFDRWSQQVLLDVTGIDYGTVSGPLPEMVLRVETPAPALAR